MMLGSFQHPTVLVLGLGHSGLAMASWCARQGCELYLADTRTAPHEQRWLECNIHHAVQCPPHYGPFTSALLNLPQTHPQQSTHSKPIELIALSPGLSPQEPGLAHLLDEAQRRGIPIWGELEFFAQALKALRTQGYTPKVLAITGTNGKTTTTALTGQLCQQAGLRTAVAGNIGPSLLDELTRSLGPSFDTCFANTERAEAVSPIADTLPEVWVLELSSFQLQAASSFCPDAAVILNLSVDHLDWHETFEAYAHAKARIFGPTEPHTYSQTYLNTSSASQTAPKPTQSVLCPQATQTVRVLNRDDPHTLYLAKEWDAAHPLSVPLHHTVTFGLNIPQRPGDWGLVETPTMTWLVRAKHADSVAEMSTEHKDLHQEKAHLIEYILPTRELHIEGRHNLANAMAALALCSALNRPIASFIPGLRDYQGESHRFEPIASFDGLRFIDDSKATNMGATLAALEGLHNQGHQHVVLILGGEGKGQDFSDLVKPITQTCRAVMLIGQAAPDLRATLSPSGIPLYDFPTLEEATRAAASFAQPGNTILLSPCCASLDMFRNYIHRAEVFRHVVRELSLHSGATA